MTTSNPHQSPACPSHRAAWPGSGAHPGAVGSLCSTLLLQGTKGFSAWNRWISVPVAFRAGNAIRSANPEADT